ncbi:lysyl oxidase homolog 3A-like [Lytechinus variegatus]|uniref:lysyl oxidase homolog 3A-like n=1 Tax=Lytechinus variegatus TaxID=7654 RepID=UPI001BB2530D|nr:lysyl oxidase homolog 3A-like [Lytechinus variegatus]
MVRCVITDVQLVGGPSSNKGTVEIKQDGGDWETTCGTNLDINDVIVICRQLGFTGASQAVKTTPYGQNSNPLIGLNCYGSEGSLSACSTLPTSGCSSAGSASCHGDGYLGCFMDTRNGRVLSGESMLNISLMSISYCIQFCQGSTTANYVYAGVESGNECYCGKASDNYTRHGVGVNSDCSLPCHGDPTESCGGPGYIAVFRNVQLVGGPASNKGTVEIKQDGGDWETTCGMNLDINDVIVICRQLGFTGASLAMTATPYKQNSTPAIGLGCDGSEGSLSECPTVPPTSGCSPAGSASCHGERYLGCFKDNTTDRVLSSKVTLSSEAMSISYCIWFCRDFTTSYFTYLGVENGNECYCGVASDNYARHGVGVDSECSAPCHGDPTDSCGASGYIAVFEVRAAMVPTMNTPPESMSMFPYLSCL